MRYIIPLFLLLFLIVNVSADIISINAGGSDEAIITDKYIYGFYFGDVEEVEEQPGEGRGIIPGIIEEIPELIKKPIVIISFLLLLLMVLIMMAIINREKIRIYYLGMRKKEEPDLEVLLK